MKGLKEGQVITHPNLMGMWLVTQVETGRRDGSKTERYCLCPVDEEGAISGSTIWAEVYGDFTTTVKLTPRHEVQIVGHCEKVWKGFVRNAEIERPYTPPAGPLEEDGLPF